MSLRSTLSSRSYIVAVTVSAALAAVLTALYLATIPAILTAAAITTLAALVGLRTTGISLFWTSMLVAGTGIMIVTLLALLLPA